MESRDSKKNLKSDQSEAPESPRPAPSAERTLHETSHETSMLSNNDRHVADTTRPEVISGTQGVEKDQKNMQKDGTAKVSDVGQLEGTWELPPFKEAEWTTVTSKKLSRTTSNKKTANSEGTKASKHEKTMGLQQNKAKAQERCRAHIRGFCQFGNKCWHSHEKPTKTKLEATEVKVKRVQAKLFDWNKELKKVLQQDPPAKHIPKNDLLKRYQAIAMQPSIDLDIKIDLTEEQNAIVEAWFHGQIILEQPPYFLNQCYDVYQVAHIQAAFRTSTQGLIRMPLQASMRVSPGLLHHAIMNSMKLPDNTDEEQKEDLARFKDSIATSYVDNATNTIFFQTHNKAAAETWHGRYMPFQNRPTRLWNTEQGDPTIKYQDVEDQESRQYHVKLVEITANITQQHQLAMWEHLKIEIQTMTSRGNNKTRSTEASTVKVMFPTAFVPDSLKKKTCLEWYETRGQTPARRRIYIEHYQLEKGSICPICLHAGHNMMTCRDEEDKTKKITLPNDFFHSMTIKNEPPTSWKSLREDYQKKKQAWTATINAQTKAKEEEKAKAQKKLEDMEREAAHKAKQEKKQQEDKVKKATVKTPSPMPQIKLSQKTSIDNGDKITDDTCEYSHTEPPTSMEHHHVGPIDELLAATNRYVAPTVGNGTCFSAAIMIAWRNKPLEHPTKFTGAELEEIRAVDQARMEAWAKSDVWKDIYKNAPFVPKDSSPEKIYKLTKAFFKAIIKPLATAGRKSQHFGSEADIYTASLAMGVPIYLFERHTTTSQPTQHYWTLSEYLCDDNDKTCYVLNKNKWQAILASNTSHVIRYINNNHFDAIPQRDGPSNEDKEKERAIILEEMQALVAPPPAEITKCHPVAQSQLTIVTQTKPARQSSIQSFFPIVSAPLISRGQLTCAEQANDDMDCTTPEAERKRKREQRDQEHDSEDDKLEKISKAATPINHQNMDQDMDQDMEQVRMRDTKHSIAQTEEHLENPWTNGQLVSFTRPAEVTMEPIGSTPEEVTTQHTDTLTWDNEQLHNTWTEEQAHQRQLRFNAVSEDKIRATQRKLQCNTQEAINDIFIEIHNEVMARDTFETQSSQHSQLDDSDYTPPSSDTPPSNDSTHTKAITNDDNTIQDIDEDRTSQLLDDIRRFKEGRQGITKETPTHEAQVDAWCKRHITHLEELIHFTTEVGTLLNLLSPETLDEYGQRLIVDATIIWLAKTTRDKPAGTIDAWYMELSNEGINTKMRYARATSRTMWSSYSWEENQKMVNAWLKIQNRKRSNMAILRTLPAVTATEKTNMVQWITEHARNPSLTKLLMKTDWEALAGITSDQWQSLLQC